MELVPLAAPLQRLALSSVARNSPVGVNVSETIEATSASRRHAQATPIESVLRLLPRCLSWTTCLSTEPDELKTFSTFHSSERNVVVRFARDKGPHDLASASKRHLNTPSIQLSYLSCNRKMEKTQGIFSHFFVSSQFFSSESLHVEDLCSLGFELRVGSKEGCRSNLAVIHFFAREGIVGRDGSQR